MIAALLAVCAGPASESLATKPQRVPEPRIATKPAPRGRFVDQDYLITPGRAVWKPLVQTDDVGWLQLTEDEILPSSSLLHEETRPTGLIDEVLFGEPTTWKMHPATESDFSTRGVALDGWSGFSITSTVGE